MLQDDAASFSRRRQFQESLEPAALRAIELQKVHASGVRWILSSFQKPSLDKCVERLSDLFHVASHKRGDLFIRQ